MTEFLSERNIQATAIRDRYLRTQQGLPDTGVEPEEPASEDADAPDEDVEVLSDPEPVAGPSKQATKRKRGVPKEATGSDDEPVLQTARARRAAAARKQSIASEEEEPAKGKGKKKRLTKKQQQDLEKKKQQEAQGSDSEDEGPNLPRGPRRQPRSLYDNVGNNEEMFREHNGHLGRLPGQTDFCARCHCKFIVTVYSESAPAELKEKYIKERETKRLVELQLREQERLEERLRKRGKKEKRLEELKERVRIGEVIGVDEARELEEGEKDSDEEIVEVQDDGNDERVADTLLLCTACSKDQINKSKGSRAQAAQEEASKTSKLYRRKVAAALLDRKDFNNVPSLQELCVNVIAGYIEDVEALGVLGFSNRDRISRILSRNRKLTSQTAKLFLDPSIKKLELWDCSQINADTMNLITAYCPELESLTLSMCGQLRSEFLSKCARNLAKLTEVSFDGAFLVSGSAWADFFVEMGPQLKKLDIRNTHRFNAESLLVLVETCGKSLTHLTLHHMSGLTDPVGYMLLSGLTNLVHLDLSFPPQEVIMRPDANLLGDETLITILTAIGSQLHTLVLDGCAELTDRFITEGLGPCCSPLRLRRLSLSQLDQLTDDAVAFVLQSWQEELRRLEAAPILTDVSLERCIGLGDATVEALLGLVRPSIVSLNLNSVNVTGAPFERWFVGADKVPYMSLTSLNVGFVRALSNGLMTAITDKAPGLRFVEVFGVPGVDKNCVVRPGVKLIGRQDAVDL